MATDVRFVIDQLTRYDRETDFQAAFQGHLDLAHIGALGHSSGGVPRRWPARQTRAYGRV